MMKHESYGHRLEAMAHDRRRGACCMEDACNELHEMAESDHLSERVCNELHEAAMCMEEAMACTEGAKHRMQKEGRHMHESRRRRSRRARNSGRRRRRSRRSR